MKQLIAITAALLALAAVARPRLFVLTDLANEPDDEESLVRLLVYSNEFDIEGLVATTSCYLKKGPREDLLLKAIDAYAEVRGNLAVHAEGYPTADALRQVTASGQPGYGMTSVDAATPGSKLLAKAIMKKDERPLWVTVWGGANTLLRALRDAEAENGEAEFAEALGRLKVYEISDQDDASAVARRVFPEVEHIVDPCPAGDNRTYGAATWRGISGDLHGRERFHLPHRALVENRWLEENIRSKGPLGKCYPPWKYFMEGDTPSWLGFVDNGLRWDVSPAYGGWGGRYEWRTPKGETHPVWATPEEKDVIGHHRVGGNSITRWREEYQLDFAARMIWSVTPDYKGANHNPVAVVNGDASKNVVRLKAPGGGKVALSAEGSSDPDGDSLKCEWIVYEEASTVKGARIAFDGTAATLDLSGVSCDAKGEVHVILRVRDSGSPAMFAYRRIVVDVSNDVQALPPGDAAPLDSRTRWYSRCTGEDGTVMEAGDVELPHSWGGYWGMRGHRHGNLHGSALYTTRFAARREKGRRAFLVFEGAGQYLTVDLNGKRLCRREPAGRLVTHVDVTDALSDDGDNFLSVTCDHPSGIRDMPWICGGCSKENGFCEGPEPLGLFRPVHFITTDEVRFVPFGLHVWNSDDMKTVYADIEIANDGSEDAGRTLIVSCEELGVYEIRPLSVGPGESRTIRVEFHPKALDTWSAETPKLYTFAATLVDAAGRVCATDKATTGFRSIRWPRPGSAEHRFLVNGSPVFIHGTCESDHRFGSSMAFGPEEIAARAGLVQKLGFNAFRDGHEPHDLRYSRQWDRRGIYWWPQFGTHVWFDTPEFRRNYKKMLAKWVRERRNSPSVVLWGLQNESALPEDFARECRDLIRRLDPLCGEEGRLVTTCNGGRGADWNVVQNWSGTYGGDLFRYGAELSGEKQLLNGEYGAWRYLGAHSDPDARFDSKGPWSEEHAAQILHQKLMQAWAARDKVCGQFLWTLFSHENPGRVNQWESRFALGRVGPVNHKGPLTLWGERTEAYYLYLAYGALLKTGGLDAWMKRPLSDMLSEGRRLADSEGVVPAKLSPAAESGRKYVWRVNCGGDETVDSCGNRWQADGTGFSESWAQDEAFASDGLDPLLASSGEIARGVRNASQSDQELFSTYRFGRDRLKCRFSIAPLQKCRVEAYFVEPGSYGRMFDVAINGRTVEERFEMPGAFAERCVMRRVWEVRADADGIVEVAFPRVQVNQAVVSAIAVSVDAGETATVPARGSGYPSAAGTTWRELRKREIKGGDSGKTELPAPFAGGTISIGVAGDYALALDVPAGAPDGRRKWRLSSAADGRLVAEGVLNVAKGVKKAIAPVGGFVNAGDYVLTIERE